MKQMIFVIGWCRVCLDNGLTLFHKIFLWFQSLHRADITGTKQDDFRIGRWNQILLCPVKIMIDSSFSTLELFVTYANYKQK